MIKEDFFKQIKTIFSSKGFKTIRKRYYKDLSDEVMIVFGIQMSYYGPYCYMDYGYCFKSINDYLPYPNMLQINLNCGRILTPRYGQTMEWEQWDESDIGALDDVVRGKIELMKGLVKKGKREFIQHYFSEEVAWDIIGEKTAEYFGMTKVDFYGHFIVDKLP